MDTRQHKTRYRLGGFDIQSELLLPELPINPNPGPTPKILFTLEQLPETLNNPDWEYPSLQVERKTALLNAKGIARYLIRDGRQISIDPAAAAKARDVRLYLLGTAFGILCQQRDTFPLHASSVVVNGNAMAFVGPSGAGKSTLGAWLARSGLPLLGDDVCVLRLQHDAPPLAQPGSPRIKLWDDTLKALEIEPKELQRDMTRADKYHLEMDQATPAHGAPLRGIYRLIEDDSRKPHIEGPETMLDAIATIADNSYRRELLTPLGRSKQHFQYCATVARRVPVFRLYRRRDLKAMDAVIATLQAHWNSSPPNSSYTVIKTSS